MSGATVVTPFEPLSGLTREERYLQLVELAPDGIIVHEEGRITFANVAALRLAGATECEEMIGQPIGRFLEPPYLKAVQNQLTEAERPVESALAVTDVLRRLDGTDLPVEVRAVAFLEHGRVSAHLVIRDITERLALQRAAMQVADRLREAQRMELVGTIAGGVAHEVSNMMQVVLGASGFLLRDPLLPAQCLPDVQLIAQAADNAATVTRQLLAFSRRDVHRPEQVHLGAALRGAEPVIRRLLKDDQRLVLVADDASVVCVDPGQFQQVVINLALNARDAMRPDGTVTVTLTDERLDIATLAAGGATMPTGRYAVMRVHDDGAGMDAATQARIFEPFFTTKPAGMGTGLGLAAAHGVLAQNGGFLTVESAPGLGATFSVYLPLPVPGGSSGKTAGGDAAPSRPGGQDARAASILVVDDEQAVRSIVSRYLQGAGYRVVQADGGAEALELLDREGPPDLVLTDLRMPGIGGAELSRRLRIRWPQLPVLYMSGYAVDEFSSSGVVGWSDLIQKPFSEAVLLTAIAAALQPRAVRAG